MTLLTQILANPATLPLAWFGVAVVFSVAYLAWDSIANRPRQFKGIRPRKASRR